ncbi:MAG: flagellar basal body-associated FliL family protein [Lachnospiraceae bacterium]|jgi:flagellar FliL protein|nr:flagellar basal body-associated FliL family protein [Lachnospiraceae bacterium]
MKRNLLSIIILALLIVNIVLTGIMMFTVTGAAQKASALVTDIAMVMRLETAGEAGAEGGVVSAPVPMQDSVAYNFEQPMTIPLRAGEADTMTHYIVVLVTLDLNSKHDDYADNGEGDLTAAAARIQNEIIDAFSQYTIDEVRADQEAGWLTIKPDILERIHGLYDSDFIYNISFRDIKYQ